jgi:DNA-binding NarL/FixJ family response regulator
MSEALKKVLIVEDSQGYQRDYARALTGKVEILAALTIDDAEDLFVENPDISAIVMDACVPGDDPTTPPLVRKIRETFTGPMIAASSDWDYRQELVAAGCDHEVPKGRVPAKLIEVLGL